MFIHTKEKMLLDLDLYQDDVRDTAIFPNIPRDSHLEEIGFKGSNPSTSLTSGMI